MKKKINLKNLFRKTQMNIIYNLFKLIKMKYQNSFNKIKIQKNFKIIIKNNKIKM